MFKIALAGRSDIIISSVYYNIVPTSTGEGFLFEVNMERWDCTMCHELGGIQYCNYYDVFYMRCDNVVDCPENLDNDDCYEEDNEDGSWDVNY